MFIKFVLLALGFLACTAAGWIGACFFAAEKQPSHPARLVDSIRFYLRKLRG